MESRTGAKIMVSLMVLAFAFFCSASGRSAIVVPLSKSAGKDLRPLKIVSEDVQVEINNQVARTTVTQVFLNNTDSEVEGTFYLPLPARAGVESFATWVKGVKITGQVMEKGKAKKEYKAAKRAGKDPALMEYLGDNKFQTKVAAIPPGGSRKIEFTYSEILPYDSGVVEYRYLLDRKSLEMTKVEKFNISVEIEDQKKIIDLKSTTHTRLDIDKKGSRHYRAAWKTRDLKPKSDFVLYYTVESSEFGVNFLTHRAKGEDGYFMLMIAPQEKTTKADIVNKDIIFVFDKSGSMRGRKINQARKALKMCLGFMNPGDHFNIIAFDDGLNPFRNKAIPHNAGNVAKAHKFIDNISGGGGTDLMSALIAGLDDLKKAPRPKVIIFLTDGQGQNPAPTVLQRVKDNNPMGARVFVFGVGRGVNRNLLDELALKNRGSSDYVTEYETIDDKVGAFYAKISKPVLTDMDLDYGEIVPVRVYPQVVPDVYKGSQLVITGRFRGEGKEKLMITGNINGKDRKFEIKHDWPAEQRDNSFLKRIWAKRRVEYLLTEIRLHGEKKEYKDEVISLSKEYMFMTPYTSFIAKEEKPPQVAKLVPSRIKPGDPEIYINAPESARSVVIIFPFGLTKNCVYDRGSGLWMTRFLISTETPDGVYKVLVIVTLEDGTQKRHYLRYTVDRKAPVLEVKAPRTVRAGELINVRARPVITIHELFDTAKSNGMGEITEAVKSKIDVKDVVVVLDGKYIGELELDYGNIGWRGEMEIPHDTSAGPHTLEFISTDWANNKHVRSMEIMVEKQPGALN